MKTEQILAEGARRQEGENGPQWEGQIEHMEWVERWRDGCSEAPGSPPLSLGDPALALSRPVPTEGLGAVPEQAFSLWD